VLRHAELAVVGAIALSAALCLSLLPWLFQNAIALPDALRIVISAALIAPLAFFMGMPFPMGLARVEAGDARLIPWAWATNGCASVIRRGACHAACDSYRIHRRDRCCARDVCGCSDRPALTARPRGAPSAITRVRSR
jgi:hypothetical protein